MNELQTRYIQNQILTMPLKLSNELSNNGIKFNKRSDYENIIKYVISNFKAKHKDADHNNDKAQNTT